MDYRLDLHNAVDKFEEQMTKDDALFIICHNSKQGDLLLGLNGDVNIQNKNQEVKYKKTQAMVLNMAINILRVDKDLRKKFDIAVNAL